MNGDAAIRTAGRWRRLLATGAALAGVAAGSLTATSCRGPELVLTPVPADSTVLVDGQVIGPDELVDPAGADATGDDAMGDDAPAGIPDPDGTRTLAFRYYGGRDVVLLPSVDRLAAAYGDGPGGGAPVLPLRTLVDVPVPASRWLFPFDFPLELLGVAAAGLGDQDVTLTLPEDPAPIPDQVRPRTLSGLIERATASRLARGPLPTREGGDP